MAGEIEIYISVITKTGKVWRPVSAVLRRDDIYQIVGKNPSPGGAGGEQWPFETGDLVRCKPYELTDSDLVLVAYEKVERIA
jgi:hypothetical protein